MDNEPNFVKRTVRKHKKKFSLFMAVGIFKVVLFVVLSWLIIDILKTQALLGSTIVTILTFFTTYLAYRVTKVIEPQFLKYCSTTIGFNIMTIILVWFFVDFVHLSGALSSAIVIVISFVLRYLFFNMVGLIQHG